MDSNYSLLCYSKRDNSRKMSLSEQSGKIHFITASSEETRKRNLFAEYVGLQSSSDFNVIFLIAWHLIL